MKASMSWRAAIAAVVLVIAGCGASQTPSPGATAGPGAPSLGVSPSSTVSPLPSPTANGPDVALEKVVDGLVAPVGLVAPPDGSGRLFVVDQTGLISILEDGAVRAQPFLDLRSSVVPLAPDYDERGLLGLAFHPDFARNGRFFVYYSAPLRKGAAAGQDHTDTLSEFHVLSGDPNRADRSSERKVLQFEQPQPNHSGGALGFGPDGLLYLGAGDGGGTGDASAGHSPMGNAQDTAKLNGKVMRIDVDGRKPYAIPADNPFASGPGRPEIYAYGFRNPWRLSWEPGDGHRLLVSDVGYGRYEEIDVVSKGANYGWRIREGRHCLDVQHPLDDLADCPTRGASGESLVEPVVEYSHGEIGVAVVGGYVYRGGSLPSLAGQYVFADFSVDWVTPKPVPRASLLAAQPRPDGAGDWLWRKLSVDGGAIERFITGMGEDASGELYVMTRTNLGPVGETGAIFRIVPAGS